MYFVYLPRLTKNPSLSSSLPTLYAHDEYSNTSLLSKAVKTKTERTGGVQVVLVPVACLLSKSGRRLVCTPLRHTPVPHSLFTVTLESRASKQ